MIWFDISGIYNWKGNFTGIQRIVYNLAKEFNKSNESVGFFIYHSGAFIEVDFTEFELRLEELNRSDDKHSKKTSKRQVNFSAVQHHSVVALKNTLRGTRIEPLVRVPYVGARTAYRNLRGIKTHTNHNNIFKSEDIVIVVDGNWQFNGFAKALGIVKAKTKFKLIHFVHDITAIKNPALASPKADKIIGDYFTKIFSFVDLLITISDSTKIDTEWFLQKYGITNQPKIKTLIMGDNMSEASPQPIKPDVKIDPSFILTVSTIEVRKNYLSLYYAYKLAIEKGVELPHLIIVGKKGWMAEEVYALLTKDEDIKSRVTILHGISDQELEWLYANCLFTVFPSFYEGWGLPIIESFARGKSCICSNTSSMPEAGGSLAIYISPYNTEELFKTIFELSSNKEMREAAELKIKLNYEPHTWQQSFTQLEHMLKDL